jgi:hypothetical protein
MVTEVRDVDWGTGLLLLTQVVLFVGLAEVDVVALDPLTGGTPMLSFGPVINWGLFKARDVAVATVGNKVVLLLVMTVVVGAALVEEMGVEEMVVVVVVEVEVVVAGEGIT